MEENGSWTRAVLHDGTVRRLGNRSSSLHQALRKSIAFPTSLSFWTFATIGILLCHLHSAGSEPTVLCPSQCSCSNMTTASGRDFLTINCSNGNLQSFFDYLSHDLKTRNASNESESNPLPNMSDNNITNLFIEAESNETRQSLWRGTMDPSPDKISNANSSHSDPPRTSVTLDLSFNNVSSLQALTMSDWETVMMVKKLNLSNNWIETFENFTLEYLVNLVSLDLSKNYIITFSPYKFQYLSSLQYLYLNNNRIVDIQIPVDFPPPQSLLNLVYLDLSHNQLVDLPAGAFSVFPMLMSLNLTDNNITRIDRLAFQGLPQLQYLSLSHNFLLTIDDAVFQNTSLIHLMLADLPQLSTIHHNAFKGLTHLQYLNLSHSSQLEFLNPNVFYGLNSLTVLDISGSGIQQLSPLTFQNNPQLKKVYLQDVPLTCQCTNAWMVEEFHKNDSIFHNASSFQCSNEHNQTVSLADAVFPCKGILIHNMTSELSVNLGSSLMLQCKEVSSSGGGILTWTTPRGEVFHFHDFHQNATQHLLSPQDVQPNAPFHKTHYWHNSSSYHSELSSYNDRVLILSDGSLFIDYTLRTDTGTYTCEVKNAHYNSSGTVTVFLIYKISTEIKIIACIVGILCAVAFFTLNLIYVVIVWLARHLINKRRREHISQMLENLNTYKSSQITRIHENYTSQLSRVRTRYHAQRDRLHRNYTMQVDRVKRGCSHQVEKVRENYNSKLTHLRDYSSNQIVQIRDIANTQIGRIRDYGSLQLDRLRETYKFQQQHMLKLLDTLNLDNCRSIVETECMRTESMMYDLDLLSQEDERTESPFSTADSEYNTATSSPMMSVGSGQQNFSSPLHEQERDENEISTNGYERSESEVHDPRTENTDINPDDIEIEMNTVIQLSGNGELDAKETWTYENGAHAGEPHTLYLKAHPQGKECYYFQEEPHKERSANAANTEGAKTMTGVSLPSVNMNHTDDSPQLEETFVHQEPSPTKVWIGTADYFQYEDDENISTVTLYDADIDEDEEEEEEKTENDTMV